MTVKTRDKSKKRAAILEAAVSAFVETGFDRASMDHIADIAAVSKRTIYNHFSSKELLFNAVIEQFIESNMAEKHIPYRADIDLKQQLYQFADLKINLLATPDRMQFMRMAFGVLLTHPTIAESVMANADNGDDGFVQWLTQAVADKKLIIEDIELATQVFWSMFSSCFFWMPIIQGQVDETTTTRLKNEFVDTFLAKYGV